MPPLNALLLGVAALLALPVLGVLGAWSLLDTSSLAVLVHQWQTVLPDYAVQSAALVAAVAVGVMLVGGATAVAVTLFDFPGRRAFEWLLLLPLAFPAYVLAYAWTDALQPAGPVQTALRALTGAEGPLWPDVRSLWGAAVLFVFCLYPYVYLLARTALGERAAPMMEAARMLGAPLARRVREVALPLARPAVAAGVALALMETLADYGVGAYFGLTTLTTGIYHAWMAMEDPLAATQLASLLLAVVAVLMTVERRAQSRLRFSTSRPSSDGASGRPLRLRGGAVALAWGVCALPVLIGFLLPLCWLMRLLWREAAGGASPLFEPAYLQRYAAWAWTSVQLAGLAALCAVLLALLLAYALRRARGSRRGRPLRVAARVVTLGYAIPGAVVAVGILVGVGALQAAWPAAGFAAVATGTAVGLLYAYLVRFAGVALQSVEAGYARVPASIDETARLLGAPPRRMFLELHLPLLGRSALAAALLVFVDTMKELPATLVLRPFGSDTLAVVAYQFARDERLAEAALPSLAIVAVGLVPVIMLSRALRGAPGATGT